MYDILGNKIQTGWLVVFAHDKEQLCMARVMAVDNEAVLLLVVPREGEPYESRIVVPHVSMMRINEGFVVNEYTFKVDKAFDDWGL